MGLLHRGLATLDLPVLERLIDAWRTDNRARVDAWSAWLARAARRVRRAPRSGSWAPRWPARWSSSACRRQGLGRLRDVTQAAMFALGAARFAIPTSAAMAGYAFAWAEARSSAAMRLSRSARARASACSRRRRPRSPSGRRARARSPTTTSWRRPRRPGAWRARCTRPSTQPVVPVMRAHDQQHPCASASAALSARARPRWCDALCKRCATATTSPSSPTTSTPRKTPQFLMRSGALAARAHHRRRDRRLPAHGDPRRRLDQPRRGRRADRSASPGSTWCSSRAAATT